MHVFAAAPAAEMPPLEPAGETESFLGTAEEESERVEAQAGGLGDGPKQVSGWTRVLRVFSL